MSRLIRDSSWLAAAMGVQVFCSVTSQRILNQHLTPEERGLIAFSMLVMGATLDLLRIGSARGVTYLVATGRPIWPVIHADLLWTLGMSLLTLAIVPVLPLSYSITGTLIPLQVGFWAWISQASRIFSTFSSALSGLGRFRDVSISAAIGSLTLLVARASLVPGYATTGEFIATSLSAVATSLLCMAIAFRSFPMEKPSWHVLGELLDYGRRSVGAQAGNIIVGRGLPLVLFPILGPSAAGVYAATAVIPTLLGTGVGLVTRPLFSRSSTMQDQDAKWVFAPACRLLTAVSAVGALAMVSCSKLLVRILGAEHYPQAQAAMVILGLQVPIRTLTLTVGAHLSGSGHPQYESRSLVLGAGCVVLLAAVGASWFGLYGALAGELLALTLRLLILTRALKTVRALALHEVAMVRASDFSLLKERLPWRR